MARGEGLGFSQVSARRVKRFEEELDNMADDIEEELRKEFEAVAADVVEKGSALGHSQGGVAAHVADDYEVVSNRILMKRSRNPAIFGAEFGGGKFGAGNPTPRGGYTTQFPPHRGREGYIIYRALRENEQYYMERYGEAIDRATRLAFPG